MKPSDFVKYGAGLAFNTAYNYLNTPSQQSSQPLGSQVQLYRNMKFYMKSRHASRSKTVVKKRRKAKRGSMGIGGVLGPPIPTSGPVSKFSKFAKYGSHGQDETFGTIDKSEMVYIGLTSAKCTAGGTETSGTSSWSGSIIYHVAAALLRNILRKEFKEDICRHDQLITGKSAYGNFPNIHFIWKEDALGTVIPTFGTVMVKLGATCTAPAGTLQQNQRMFGDVAREIAQNVISAADFGGVVTAEGFTRSVYGYYITSADANVSNVQVETSNIRRLDNQYLVAYSTAEIALQNVTVADATADTSGVRLDNRIDSNPLDCAVFKFKTPYPKVRLDGFSNYPVGVFPSNAQPVQGPAGTNADSVLVPDNSYILQYDTNADGVIVPSGTLSRDWRQLPLPDKFYGCIAHTRFKLHPGQIRKGLIKFKFEGSLNNLIKGFRVIAEGDSTRYNSKDSFGTSLLFAMEKVMSTGTDTSVTVNYQVSYWSGAYMKRQKGEVMQSYNHTGTYAPSTAAGYGNYGAYTAGAYTGGAD